jgi:glutamate racemase
LLRRGVAVHRISATSCHGLATAIEQGPHSTATGELIDDCAARAAANAPPGSRVCAGLCCTHYGLVAGEIQSRLARHTGRSVTPLDPNVRLVRDVTASLQQGRPAPVSRGSISVEVISKVTLNTQQRIGMAEAIEPVLPATAAALRAYRQVPDLFEERA